MASTSPLPKNAASIGIESRRERQRQEARRAILDSTQGLLSESEGGDFSIRSLAARCGYSAPWAPVPSKTSGSYYSSGQVVSC